MADQMIAFFPSAKPTQQPTQQKSRPVEETTSSVQVEQKVVVEQIASRSDLTKGSEDWTWSELRDYVCAQILDLHGPFPRDAKKEFGIFSRFIKEHGQDGVAVAHAAFEIYNGWWKGAPISINRFTKGSDPYFVQPILSRLNSQ